METQRKCSSKKHGDINAICYCLECKIYMCNKCSNYHSELLENHHKYELDKENKEIFTGLCKEEKHNIELQFYCKTHNQLCCAACISKIKGKGNGQHTDCNVCYIEEIEEEKKNKLKENIKFLENYSNEIENSINELKGIFEKINENKEEIKMKIAKIFTKIRNIINEREDELLISIDNKFDNLFFKEDIIKQSEKLPKEIKLYLNIGKEIDNKWNKNDKNLNLYINDCINIENNIKNILSIKENIIKCNSMNIKTYFIPEEEDINKLIKQIKNFGELISENECISSLKESSIINNNKAYEKRLKDWINPKKNIKAELLYRLTRDGEKISKFHELCDDKGPTLTLFNVENGNKGGIFTPLTWETNTIYKYDESTFMFNLNKNEQYKNIKNKDSIYCTESFGPWTISFGFQKTMKIIEHRGSNINKYYERGSEILPNNSSNTKYFNVLEVEVYKIIIEDSN